MSADESTQLLSPPISLLTARPPIPQCPACSYWPHPDGECLIRLPFSDLMRSTSIRRSNVLVFDLHRSLLCLTSKLSTPASTRSLSALSRLSRSHDPSPTPSPHSSPELAFTLIEPPTMFYEPGKTDHSLPHDPFKACVIPRPIGWISTVSPTAPGQSPIYNLAPFSQFNNLTFDPPYVMFSSNQTIPPSQFQSSGKSNESSTAGTKAADEMQRSPGWHRKDTVHNVESTGYFCWQLATYELRDLVNRSAQSLPYSIDEFEHCNIEKAWSEVLPLKIPMVKDSPVRFECQYFTTLRLPGTPPFGTVDVVRNFLILSLDEASC